MRKRIALVGLVILIVGIVLLAVGVSEVASNTFHSKVYTQYSAGKYVSSELNFKQNATVVITKFQTTMGLVRSADMPSVTNSTLGSIRITPLTTTLGSEVFQVPSGSYYVVYFGNATPASIYTYVYTSAATTYGLMTSGGLLLAIAGGIVGIVGVVLKSKQPVA